MRNPRGKPTQIVIRRGTEVLVSSYLVSGGEDAHGVWETDRGMAEWLSDAGRPAPGALHRSLRSVVTGHVRYGGKPDVFWRLREVRSGDLVFVSYPRDTAVFRIVESPRGFSKSEMVRQDAYWDVTRPGRELTLITCDQTSVKRPDGHLSDNLAVRATRIK